ncbi:PREDICTED: fibropellin-3-like [Branchiostoma belcheri]|uniref:Fibropellin-3-like n=1 Tax=Branchiostoma belcheri TaxID=7741 RepID=A0A6P5ADC1_BRABE|nr:PREDICTED: fibropellin-3-like [Branchiostoma belcheri]
MGRLVLSSLVLVACAITLASGFSVYLSSWSGWGFYKVKVTGPMTNVNVKSTCEAAGMQYPCFGRDGDFHDGIYWEPGCITYSADGISNHIQTILSAHLCVEYNPLICPALHDLFVVRPDLATDSAQGHDVVSNTGVQGSGVSDKYALCAKPSSCSSSPCLHGTCEDRVKHYSCGSNCPNGDHEPYYVCWCEPGWFGDTCQIDIDECQSSPCSQSATCVDHVNGYTCQCPPGFTGNSCETAINWCDPNPCPSGWTCVAPDLGAFHCQAPGGSRGYTGHFCAATSCGPDWSCREDGYSGYTCLRG